MVARRTSKEIPTRHEKHGNLYWFGPLESKTLRPVWWWYYARESCPRGESQRALEGRPRPSYIGWCALGYKSISIYPSRLQHGRLIRTALNYLECLDLHSKMSSCPWAHMSGRGGPTDRSVGLLVGRVRLLGTTETLVGGTHG
jgi:hypothetical protein